MTDTTPTDGTTTTDPGNPDGQQDTSPAPREDTPRPEGSDAAGVSQHQPSDSPAGEQKMFPENHVKDLRNEAAKYRTERNELAQRMEAFESEQKAMVQNLAKALGLADAEAEKSPDDIIAEIAAERDKFAEERDTYQQRLAEFRRTEAIRQAAKTADADADILLDSRTFTDKVQALDTDDDNYPALVADLVADAVNTNPRYKATPAVPTTSGSDPQKSAAPAEAPSGPAAWHAKRFPKK
ncbi:hypothetical protein G6009_00710 [Dietzia sp. SLG510A3-30A2]|nr:hypothetical protein [Dietzia sp. SLG510A3-30A2]